MADKARIIELQRQVRIAKTALEKIRHADCDPVSVAADALDHLLPLDRKLPLQGICGHERRPRS